MKYKFLILAFISVLALSPGCAPEEDLEPDADPREKFLGGWKVSEEIQGGNTTSYLANVIVDPANTSRIRIGNIFNLGPASEILAIVAGNSLTLESSSVSGFTLSGTGSYSSGFFILDYTSTDGDLFFTVKATYTRP